METIICFYKRIREGNMKKIVVIGAGSAMFAKKLIGDLMLFDDMQIDNISLRKSLR